MIDFILSIFALKEFSPSGQCKLSHRGFTVIVKFQRLLGNKSDFERNFFTVRDGIIDCMQTVTSGKEITVNLKLT